MRNILIIGAGRSASSLIKYLLDKSDQEKGDEKFDDDIQPPRRELKLSRSNIITIEEKNYIEDVIHFLASKGHHDEMIRFLRLGITIYGINLATNQSLKLRVHLSVASELLAKAVIKLSFFIE
jgi:hypothetical protein